MCLAIPMKVKTIDHTTAMAEVNNVDYEINISMMQGLKIGDYVIVHAGFAIEKLDEKEALKTLSIWKEIEEFSKNKNGL
ncbi:MAG: HypC/HybG/HupF family hydrogenase formation chaperone [Candidatus Marinimicrobia bacterium]|nr:HypC/HybG/HupF family hydrogenase formation chaperone [Candidatus Neomarinimicrobiota bacterium]